MGNILPNVNDDRKTKQEKEKFIQRIKHEKKENKKKIRWNLTDMMKEARKDCDSLSLSRSVWF